MRASCRAHHGPAVRGPWRGRRAHAVGRRGRVAARWPDGRCRTEPRWRGARPGLAAARGWPGLLARPAGRSAGTGGGGERGARGLRTLAQATQGRCSSCPTCRPGGSRRRAPRNTGTTNTVGDDPAGPLHRRRRRAHRARTRRRSTARNSRTTGQLTRQRQRHGLPVGQKAAAEYAIGRNPKVPACLTALASGPLKAKLLRQDAQGHDVRHPARRRHAARRAFGTELPASP